MTVTEAKKTRAAAVRGPDIDCDVCILGGTLAGLTLALALALRGRSVTLLHAGAIGPYRGSGLIRPGFGRTAQDLCAAGARADVQALYDVSAAGARSAIRLMDALDIPRRATGRIHLAGPRGRLDLIDEVAARDALGLEAMEPLHPDAVREALGLPAPFGALRAADCALYDARDMPAALVRAARAAGVRLFEHMPVRETDFDGVRKYIETSERRIRAEHVVLATDRGLRAFAPYVARALIDQPFVSGTFSLDRPGRRASEAVIEGGARGLAFDFEGRTLHLRAPTAGYLRGETSAALALRRHARRLYPELRRAVVGEAMGERVRTSRHRLPLIGAFRPGLWYAVGLGAEPLSEASLVADLVGDAIIERDDRLRVFAPFGPRYAFGWPGALVRKAAYWLGRASDASERAEAMKEAPPPEAGSGTPPLP